ncbi:MAG: hypothetical protein QM492_06100 [Rhodobacterales bacterium]
MINLRWLLRMKRWSAHPPSPARVKLVFAILLACAALYGYDYLYGWPKFLTLDGAARHTRLPRL